MLSLCFSSTALPEFSVDGSVVLRSSVWTDLLDWDIFLSFWSCLLSFIMLNQIYKVPATDMEALKSPLMGLFEKRRARNFFIYVQDYNEADPKTHQGLDLTRVTTRELIASVPLSLF